MVLVAAWLVCMPAAWADGGPPRVLSKGPYLTELSEAGVDVRFELSAPSAATVEVHGDGPLGRPRTFEDRAATAMHVVAASGLSPATVYAYAVRVRGKVVAEGHFTTSLCLRPGRRRSPSTSSSTETTGATCRTRTPPS